MSARAVIDSLAFAGAGQELRGSLPVDTLERLKDCLSDTGGVLEFVAKGGSDSERRPVLTLTVSGLLHLRCQRCLDMVDYEVQVASTLRLLRDGEKLATDVADPDAADCIEASAELDLAGLIEDEILLSLPFSPRHAEGTCRSVLRATHVEQAPAFAKLAALKKR